MDWPELDSDDDFALIADAINVARKVQEFIWGGCYPALRPYDARGWHRLFQKRVDCIAEVDLTRHGGLAALRKRLLQQAALSIKALALVNRWARNSQTVIAHTQDGADGLPLSSTAPASTVAPQQSELPLLGYERVITIEWDKHNARRHELIEAKRSRSLSESETTELSELQWLAGIKRELANGPAALQDEADRVSAFAGSERLSAQEDKPVKNYDDFRAGMLRAAEIARNEFKRASEAAKGHDCVYTGGYEDACDHLSVAIAQAAVIDSVRIAGPQPDWQYHIALLFPDGIEDETLLKIFQVVEHELRAATTPPSTRRSADDIVVEFLQNFTKIPLDEAAHREMVRIIEAERCFSAESFDNDNNEGLQR